MAAFYLINNLHLLEDCSTGNLTMRPLNSLNDVWGVENATAEVTRDLKNESDPNI